MKLVIKTLLAASLVFTAQAQAWNNETFTTPNPKIGTMFSWWAGKSIEANSLVLNCLSTGGAWVTLNTNEGRYQVPKLENFPAITRLEIGDADGTTYLTDAQLHIWNKSRSGDLQNLIYALNHAVQVLVTTDDGQQFRIRPKANAPMANTEVCKAGLPGMVNPKTNTVYSPEEMGNL